MTRDRVPATSEEKPIAPDAIAVAPPAVAYALAMQQGAGNRATSAVLARDPATPAAAPVAGTLDAALDSRDPDQVLDLDEAVWASASNRQRSRAVHVILGKYVMFPWNDAKVSLIVSGYDTATLDAADLESVQQAVDRGSISGASMPGYSRLVRGFEAEVERRAGDNVRDNLAKLEEIAKQFGIGREAEGGASGIPSAMDRLQDIATKVADARHYQASLRKVPVGHKIEGFLPTGELIHFDPDRPPESLGPMQRGDTPEGITPWAKVKAADDAREASIGKMMSANPALYLLASTPALDQRMLDDDDRLHFGKSGLAGFHDAPQESAKKELDHAYEQTKKKLELVQQKLGEHGIDPLSLDALGLRVASDADYATPFGQWATHHAIQVEQTRKENIATFLDFATAVLVVGATIGTLGGAAAAGAVLAGGATAAGIASAGVKLSNAADLDLQAGAKVDPKDALTSPVRASAAEMEAAIATAIAILSVLPFLQGLLFARGGTVLEQLASLRAGKLSESAARKAVVAGIRELGVAQTAEAAGLEVDKLFTYLEHGTPEYAQVLEVAMRLRDEAKLAVVNFRGRPIAPSFTNYSGWHGDPVTPQELRARGGFKASGSNNDLWEHMYAKGKASSFMGTTEQPLTADGTGGAAHWNNGPGYVYKINAGEAWDTGAIWAANADLAGGENLVRGELEIAIRANVPWESIEGWYEVLEGQKVDQLKLGSYTSRVDWEARQAAKAAGR